ncbi:PREDICTED: uncharacterized protein LOC105963322 [Erythranthe guttata]|uniref:uncharacterized protein LOC105963322 n=1 Tax=Erythranthe guttata TaxID=4155 RepID=UPI00064E0624|nr:PREDICTED: uncharacterized protein LOC105963322 [Erythranthe guttata]|eukprot:XP_012843168.1 PREDICTED: uncharacterized protein LOC105963322 [Erythranthe guttata]
MAMQNILILSLVWVYALNLQLSLERRLELILLNKQGLWFLGRTAVTKFKALFAKHCSSKYLANKYVSHLRSNPEWPVNSMLEIMQMECKTNLTISKMHRTKKQALKLNEGTEAQQYAKLWDYIEEMKTKNPDTTIKVKCKSAMDSETATFKALYICWGALKKGFLAGCRPIIGLDGTHLKTAKGGVLLTAIGVDGNNCMYPFAYAMVIKENTKTWEWFVSLLIDDLGIKNSFGYTIISDKQKGLIKAIENLLPNSEHRFCLRHMYNNFKMKHKGLALKDLLWRAATSTRVADFNRVMEEFKKVDSAAFDWLKGKSPMNWSRSHFSTWPKCDMLLNNLCESFNRVIMKARDKPIITMCEIIRLLLMKRIHVQRDKVLKSKGIPCVHGIACIFHNRAKVEDYVDKWYTKDTFFKAYEHVMEPVRGREEWPHSNLKPLVPWILETKKLGRPCKYARKKELDELIIQQEIGKKMRKGGSKYMCSKCGRVKKKVATSNQPLDSNINVGVNVY